MSGRRLDGKVAIVTGSGRGIGKEEAMALARNGAKLVISDIGKNSKGESSAEAAAAEIRALGTEAIAVSEDLAQSSGAARTVEAAIQRFGGLDILINNAGLRGGNPIHKLSEEDWDRVVGSHLKAHFLMIKYAVPHLRTRGGGVIINTGSEAGLGMPFNAAYAAAKEGIAGLTRSVAREQARYNIRCNQIRPRAIGGDTGGGDWFQKKLRGDWAPVIKALGPYWIGARGLHEWDRPTLPDSIGAFVAWLCTDAARNLNGQDFYVGGDEIAMLSPPEFAATLFREGGWTVDTVEKSVPAMTGALTDLYRFPNPLQNDD